MGLHGSIVIYPKAGRPSPANQSLEQTALRVVEAFERLGLARKGTAYSLTPDRESTSATSSILDDNPEGIEWVHVAVDPALLLASIGEVVYAATAKEFWEPDTAEQDDAFAVPYLDVTVLSAEIPAINHDGSIACTAWAFVEFSYEDVRLSSEIHRIRDESHQILKDLESVFGTRVGWTVVSG